MEFWRSLTERRTFSNWPKASTLLQKRSRMFMFDAVQSLKYLFMGTVYRWAAPLRNYISYRNYMIWSEFLASSTYYKCNFSSIFSPAWWPLWCLMLRHYPAWLRSLELRVHLSNYVKTRSDTLYNMYNMSFKHIYHLILATLTVWGQWLKNPFW